MVQVNDLSAVAWDEITDVVVVGSGGAGMSAAVAAAEAGAAVVVLERADQLGGTTAKSGGAMWVPDNPLQAARGWADSHADAVAYLARLAYPQRYNPDLPHLGLEQNRFDLIDTYCRRAGEAVRALEAAGALHVRITHPDGSPVVPSPDYQSDLPEHGGIVGRTVGPAWPDGEELPDGLRDPGENVLIGGMLMTETMRRAVVARGGQIRTGTRVVDVVADEETERVIGVVVHVGHRAEVIGARQAVVFGSGGFLMNLKRRDQHLGGLVFGGCAADTNEGDLLAIASKLGVEFSNMHQAWWDQVVLEVALRTKSTADDVFIPFGDSMVQVNKYGRRVMNEKQTYNERGPVHFVWNPSSREYSNMLLFQIWDEAVASDPTRTYFRGYVPYPGEQADYVVQADTLEHLADAIDARLETLAASTGGFRLDPSFGVNLLGTIARFNEFARTGLDEDFERGQNDLQRAWQFPRRTEHPNVCMAPFSDSGPYYAMIVAAGALDTKGGPEINPCGQILRSDGGAVPGLYGAGNCVASPMGQAYPGPGGTIGTAVVYGYIAGQNAAAEDAAVL